MSERGSLRRAVGRVRDRPALLVLGAASALATVFAVATLVPVGELLESSTYRQGLLAIAAWLLLYDAVLVALKPAILPGIYALATDGAPPDGGSPTRSASTRARPATAQPLRHALAAIRRDYVAVAAASLRARVASVSYALLFAPPIVGLVGVLATVASAAGYWLGVLQRPSIEPFQFGLLLLVLATWFAGKWPTALAEPLVVASEHRGSDERRTSGEHRGPDERRVSPARAWRRSALLTWDRPRTAGLLAAQRLALGAVVFAAFVATAFALPEDQPRTFGITLAAMLVVGVGSKAIEGVLLADGVDRLDLAGARDGAQPANDGVEQPASDSVEQPANGDGDPSSNGGVDELPNGDGEQPADVGVDRVGSGESSRESDRVVTPSRGRLPLPTLPDGAASRVAIAAVLVLTLVAGTAAVRVTDVRPSPGPAAPAAAQTDDVARIQSADELYASARARTTNASRTATMERASRNWTGGAWRTGWRLRLAIDYADRVGAVRGTRIESGSATHAGRVYLTDGLYASRRARHDARAVLATQRVGSWTVSAAPGFPDWVDTAPIRALPPASDGWTWVERDADPIVVAVDDPEAVERVASEPVNRRTYRSESRIVARIDRQTGRIQSVAIRERSVTYRTDEREEVSQRLDVRRTIEYGYRPTIEAPAAGGEFPLQYVWDAIYY